MPALPSLLRRYLVSDAPPLSRAERWRSTLAGALGEIDSYLDVREDDLVDLYERTLRRAFERMHGVRCGDLVAALYHRVQIADAIAGA